MKFKVAVCFIAFAIVLTATSQSEAQLLQRLKSNSGVVYDGMDANGMVTSNYAGRLRLPQTLKMAARNKFSPERVYTYSNPGVLAQQTHQWNQNEAMSRPWHDNFSYWRWGQPTALVVPPTASYESEYAWGVGQTKSTPIHSQFGRNGGGMIGGGGAGAQHAPYWPSSTRQFGIYPVRGPW